MNLKGLFAGATRKRPTGKRVVVVFAHPNRSSFVGAMLDRCLSSLRSGGAEVRLIDLYADGFVPAMSRSEWNRYPEGAVTAEIEYYVHSLRWADALVLVYPTWFGSQPAILKGWFDRVWLPGVAFSLPEGRGHLRPLLRNIASLTVVTSHGSGKLMNALQGEPGKRAALRGFRSLCNRRCRSSWVAFYGNDGASDPDRHAFLGRVTRHFAAGGDRSGRGPGGV